jgi:hypothetical protein
MQCKNFLGKYLQYRYPVMLLCTDGARFVAVFWIPNYLFRIRPQKSSESKSDPDLDFMVFDKVSIKSFEQILTFVLQILSYVQNKKLGSLFKIKNIKVSYFAQCKFKIILMKNKLFNFILFLVECL